jgi:hypothetical protein
MKFKIRIEKQNNVVVIMVDLDLDIVNGKQPTVKLFGRDVAFRDLAVEDYLNAEFILQELDAMPMASKEDIKLGAAKIHEYMHTVLDITKAESKKITVTQFRAFRTFMARKDMYDQGFSDEEIDKMEREALKKQAAQILK